MDVFGWALRARRVRATRKAEQELEELGWELLDVYDALGDLGEHDFLHRERARAASQDFVWVFCPESWEGNLWIRLVEEADAFLLVVSFHEAESDPWNK